MKQKVKYSLVIVAGAILLLWLFCLPGDLFSGVPYSTVVTDRKGELLGARAAAWHSRAPRHTGARGEIS